MPPTVISPVYCTTQDLQALLSPVGLQNRVDDDANSYLTLQEQGWITAAIQWATSRCNWYLLARYDACCLAQDNMVNMWCTILAAYWLSIRRGNPAPGSFDDLYKAAIADLLLVFKNVHPLTDIGPRDVPWPVWSNIRVDMLYTVRKNRVERPLSEPSAVDYVQQQDIPSNFIIEPN